MKKRLILTLIVASLISICCKPETRNDNYMWFDCEANYEVLSNPDSVKSCIERVKDLGFDNVVVDVKSIMGEVLYDSKFAPYMSPFNGVERSRDYDMMQLFLDYGHQAGVNVYASLNIFCGGHNFMDRGIIYGDHADWQSICYENGKLVPISSIKTNYNGMVNPSNPEVQSYELDILTEFARKYPECDGLIFDRLRYDGMTADFSDLSRSQFEEWAGKKVENFPEDILSWYDENGNLRETWVPGPLFKEWCEWRASVIKDFVRKAHSELKYINPDFRIGDYTGAWYPTYYQVGVNWASEAYDPSVDFDWATPTYKNTGYAELLDLYMTGLYYSYITKEDIDKATQTKGQSSEAGLQLELKYCYSVEGGAEIAKQITKGVVPVVGSIYVEQYLGEMDKFKEAVKQSLKSTGGVMVFDYSHLGKHNLWGDLEEAMNTINN
ncbi:MAG: family 10 glycosylhydrolase [Bacteroidales bacterium]|nr:family 10 glycosylhydrolase [Bacteroidales bacterium]